MARPIPDIVQSCRRVSRRTVFAPLLGLAAATLLGEHGRAQPQNDPPLFRTPRHQFTLVRPLKTLPTVSLTDLRGRAARIAPVPGKVLLINIWATWCDA